MKEYLNKIKSFIKEHYLAIILLFLSLFFFHGIISASKILNNVHYINDVTFYSYNMKKSLSEGSLPLWTPYYYSGRPLFAQPEYYFIDLNLFFILLTGNIYLAMNFTVIVHLFLAGLGMYLLVYYLSEDKRAGFIAALLYMFNGFMHSFIIPGNIMIIEGYSLLPFILFFTIRSLKTKEYILYSMLAGIFAALLVSVGGVIYLPYLFILILAYSTTYLIDKNILNRLIKLSVAGIIIIAVFFGLSAIKLLPGLEFMKLSNRGAGISYEQYLGEPVKLSNFLFAFVSNIFFNGQGLSAAVGLAGIILLILGLKNYKNKAVIFAAIIVLLSLLLSTESFLSKLLFNVPVFSQTRHIERALVLFAFAASILAGFGLLALNSLLERYQKLDKKWIFRVIFSIIFFELFLIQAAPQSIKVVNPGEIPIVEKMSQDNSQFRVINLALKDLIGAAGYNYYAQKGISELKGGSGIWFNDYIIYLSVAQSSPAKFYAVLNSKYAILSEKEDIEGFKLIGRYNNCRECSIWEAWGPYLYNNTYQLPRYYMAPKSILIAGNQELVRQLTYTIMSQSWKPNESVLIEGAKINDYSLDFLKTFDVIFLVRDSVDDNSIGLLRQYVDYGGVIVPDLFSGQNTVTEEDVNKIFNISKGSYVEAPVKEYKNNKVILELSGQKRWLVASERFVDFPGWKASINGNEVKMHKANGIVTAVYLNGEKSEVKFEYKPKSYARGKMISVISFVLILLYFGYFIYAKKFGKGVQNQA
ncbi:hypothetical protein HY637_01140 [Candidatus Woesearchaeota archaeon]|nr:hypothetical protein [Candidatus Woesearchaeota archaeon]